jgi:hypothetical protein
MLTNCEVASCEFASANAGRQGPEAARNSVIEQVLYQGDDGRTALNAARVIRVVFLFCLCALFFMFFY